MSSVTPDELADEYADELATAAAQDRLARAAGALRGAARIAKGSNVTAALKKIHRHLESLVFTSTNKPLSEAEKDAIAEQTAKKLGLPDPKKLRPAMRQASIDNAIVVVQDIENIINTTGRK
jgi:hypothetical protein